MRILPQQVSGLHDHPIDTVAALDGLLVDERLLQLMRLLRCAETFEGDDLALADTGGRRDAGARSLAIDEHRAGATLGEPAAEAWTFEVESITQDVEQRDVRIGDIKLLRLPVHVKGQRGH